jgi:transcriptional regulator with XRE-family HTH domain
VDVIEANEMNVGQAIKMCRTRRGVSQTDLAHRVECSVSYLSMLENNKRDPTLSTLTKIAHGLNVPIGILFFLAADREELAGMDKELAGDLARTALELLSEPLSDQLPV